MSTAAIQRTDGPGRNLRNVWLGPADAWRWPMDWTFTQWFGVWLPSFVVLWFALWLVIPGLVVQSWAAWVGAGWIAALPLLDRAPRVSRWVAFAFVLFAVVAVSSLVGVQPLIALPWWLALVGALIGARKVVRVSARYIDSNRPVAWHRARFLALARRPRRVAVPEMVPAADLPVLDPLTLHEVHRAALIGDDMNNGPRRFYKRRMLAREGRQWLPEGGDLAAAEFVAWLHAQGLVATVLPQEGGRVFLRVRRPRDGEDDAVVVRPGDYVLLGIPVWRGVVAFDVLDPRRFARDYEEA